jgi:prepilin-type N-terminal cleavage/methylation domain-containing protein
MKKQSGFTLIELLLVLAIIGIISAIAIPALLSQRARARDKAATENMVGAVNDLVGQYDKLREAGSTTFATKLSSYLTKNHAGDKNPWNPAANAYPANAVTSAQSTYDTASAFATTLTASANGVLNFKLATPNGTHPGFIGGAVKVQNPINGSTTIKKVTAIE